MLKIVTRQLDKITTNAMLIYTKKKSENYNQ